MSTQLHHEEAYEYLYIIYHLYSYTTRRVIATSAVSISNLPILTVLFSFFAGYLDADDEPWPCTERDQVPGRESLGSHPGYERAGPDYTAGKG